MSKWQRAIVFDGIRLFQLIVWGAVLIIITACGPASSVHWSPSPAPNYSPVTVNQQ
jgi:hypothetical protein